MAGAKTFPEICTLNKGMVTKNIEVILNDLDNSDEVGSHGTLKKVSDTLHKAEQYGPAPFNPA